MSTTRWPALGVRPVTQVATSAAGATSSEPIAKAYCESLRGLSPKPRTSSGFSESARSATPTSVCAEEPVEEGEQQHGDQHRQTCRDDETTMPPPMSLTRVSGVEIDTKLAPNRMMTRFSATTPMPNEATNTVKNEPSSRWIGAIDRSGRAARRRATPATAAISGGEPPGNVQPLGRDSRTDSRR